MTNQTVPCGVCGKSSEYRPVRQHRANSPVLSHSDCFRAISEKMYPVRRMVAHNVHNQAFRADRIAS